MTNTFSLFSFLFFSAVFAFHFETSFSPKSSSECFIEEILSETLVVGDYRVEPSNTLELSIHVYDPHNQMIWSREDVEEGTIAFTSSTPGDYQFCFLEQAKSGFQSLPSGGRSVELKIRTGVDAQDWLAVAKREKLKPLEVELRKMETVVQELEEDLRYMRRREEVMRRTNDTTLARVLYLSLLSISIVILMAVGQLWYLKIFFKSKKLL